MATIRILVTEDKFDEAIAKFQTCKDQFAAAYNQMSTEILALNSTWNGPASEAAVEQFSQLIANLRTSDATVEQAVTGLKKAAEIYRNTHNAVVEWWDGIAEVSASPFGG